MNIKKPLWWAEGRMLYGYAVSLRQLRMLVVEEGQPSSAALLGTFGFHLAGGHHVAYHEQVHAEYPPYDAYHKPSGMQV